MMSLVETRAISSANSCCHCSSGVRIPQKQLQLWLPSLLASKPLSLKSSSLDVVSADESWVKLARLGYQFVAGPSGDPDDLVLRQLADKAVGFTWRGQEDYDAVGAAVTAHMQHLLASPLCGLEAVRLPEGVTVWASPGLQAHAGPVLLLVAGMAPGGAAGNPKP